MQKLNVAVIGHKFMGKAHSHAYRDLNMFFDLKHQVVMHTLCGVEDDIAETAEKYGYSHFTKDWKEAVDNPEIAVVDICTPDKFHKEIAVYAAKAGKHVICEKPLSLNYREACEMYEAVRWNGVVHMCNFVYRGVPAIKLAKQLIDSGKIGQIYQFTASYLQDFALPPDYPFVWRMDREMAGAGILADKGAHLIDLARYLVGEITEVSALSSIFVEDRKLPGSESRRKVLAGDAAAFIARFQQNVNGVFQVSNMCAGRKNAMLLEINGSKGSIKFDLERLNELEVYLEEEQDIIRGFHKIHVTEPYHNDMINWWPSGHCIGWEHSFLHQIRDFVLAVEGQGKVPDFYDGMKCQQVVDAADRSVQEHLPVKVDDIRA